MRQIVAFTLEHGATATLPLQPGDHNKATSPGFHEIHGVMEMRKQAISLIELHHQSLTTQQPKQYTPSSHHIQNLQEGIILPDIAISPRSRNWTPCSKKCCLESTNCNFDLSSHALHCIQICHPMYFLLVYHCFVVLLPEICQCYTIV